MRDIIARMQTGKPLVPQKAARQVGRPEGEPPCSVFVHNDATTPMDFAIHALVTVFLVPLLNAEQIMFAAHVNGKAYVQTLPAAEAMRRIGKARFAARLRGFPLDFSVESP